MSPSFTATCALPLMLMLLVVHVTTIAEASYPLKKITVRINNTLENNQELTVHCKSGDDDLGPHNLLPKNTYEFSFKRNFLQPRTLFFCTFQWPEDQFKLHYFDIYDQKRDDCSKCFWEIYKFGACLYGNCKRWNNS
ncbi:hypothetical protein D8674_010184 [Pyrus ussuriensis x Pyrus communis]|uniref:S-protein homolog n=1 Tax=Pyrus ussuriensis x Pyrus communis TaxID=2448454 RepID=A0A5N5FAS7_9ROSA|nr:hypothetical protein D8674_010184 [Pyrus ussuriensis x Pyrus communis]